MSFRIWWARRFWNQLWWCC